MILPQLLRAGRFRAELVLVSFVSILWTGCVLFRRFIAKGNLFLVFPGLLEFLRTWILSLALS